MIRGKESPILPIVIKCNTPDEAKRALTLQGVFELLGSEKDPEAFAAAIARSDQISDLFSAGPFYPVYEGKDDRAIYRNLFVAYPFSYFKRPNDRSSDVSNQVHGQFYPKYRKFLSIKDALVYMVLRGNFTKMKVLGLSSEGALTWHSLYVHSKLRVGPFS